MKQLTGLLREAIDAALETPGGAQPSVIARQVRIAHPDEFADAAFESAEKWMRDQCQSMLSARARTRQEALPGFELPSVLTVSDGEGGYRYVGMRKATLRDFDEHTEIRRAHKDAAIAEWEQCENQRSLCWTATGAHEDMLLVDAVALIGGAS